MSIFLDRQYVGYLTNRLERFKPVSSATWNCKCCFCDGSITNPRKLTAYLITRDSGIFYYCHTCQTNYPMWLFLKEFDAQLYNDYQKQRYIESGNRKPRSVVKTVRKDFLKLKLETPTNALKIDYRAILKGSPFVSLLDLPDEHETKEYLRARLIPVDQWERLAYIPRMSDITSSGFADYENLAKSKEPRLVFPIINIDKELVGASCRSLDGNNKQRYIELSFESGADMIFGLERIDVTKKVYCIEGAFDACLLDNSISIGGLALHCVSKIGIDKANMILIPDRQPRHKNVVHAISKMIDGGYNVCLLPHSYFGKDFNELLVNEEIKLGDIKNIVDANVHSGLKGKLFFNNWKKI